MDQDTEQSVVHQHASAAVTVQRLKASRGITLNLSQEFATGFFLAWQEKIGELSESTTDQQKMRLLEVRRVINKNSETLQKRYLQYLAQGFSLFKKKELNTTTGEEKFSGDMLSLVDNEDLEETIALSSVSKRAESFYGETLWALNQRFTMMNDGEPVNEKNNPIAPVQFCEALRRTLKLLDIGAKPKILAYKVFDKDFMPRLNELYDDVNSYLLEQGVLPNLNMAAQHSRANSEAASGAAQAAAAIQQANADTQSEEQMLSSIRQLQSGGQAVPGAAQGTANAEGTQAGVSLDAMIGHLSGQPLQNAGGQVMQPVQVFSDNDLVSALQGLQLTGLDSQALAGGASIADMASVVPQNVGVVNAQFIQQLKEQFGDEQDKGVGVDHMHTIDLVGMLFEYVLNDENLPDSIKALLSYLHTPFLKIAFIDPGFFEKADHPARVLLNSLAEAGSKWVNNDGKGQFGVFEKTQEVVREILEKFENDVRIFAELLMKFSGFTKKISRRVDLLEKRATEKVQGEEKLHEVKTSVNSEVRRRTVNKQVPSAVLLLLLQPWSDYLAFILLRFGEKSDAWFKGLRVIDDLLWSIEPKETQSDKVRLMELHDGLLVALRAGLESIGYDQAKGKKLLDSLESVYNTVLQDKNADPAPEPMRQKLETMAAEKAGVAPTDEFAKYTAEEQRIVDNLRMIEFGTWFEFKGGNRLKVAWYNSKTLHYMLVDQAGKKAGMKSAIELARAMLKGETKIIVGSTKPFFERALENILHKLEDAPDSVPTADNGPGV